MKYSVIVRCTLETSQCRFICIFNIVFRFIHRSFNDTKVHKDTPKPIQNIDGKYIGRHREACFVLTECEPDGASEGQPPELHQAQGVEEHVAVHGCRGAEAGSPGQRGHVARPVQQPRASLK